MGRNRTVPPLVVTLLCPPTLERSPFLLQGFGLSPLLLELAVLHALELEAVGIEEEDGVIALIIFAGRIDDFHLLLLEEVLQRIDVTAVAQMEGVVMQADIADLLALRPLRRRDPVAGLAI